MASAFEAPKKGACEVLSPDPAYVSEMLVRFNADGSKAAPEKRVALVIGNGDYEAFPDLKNPANDAAAVARLLRGLGFAVWRGVDLTSASASACLADFYRRGAEGAHVALLYYAGHGVSAGGVNALLPIDASFTDASESALNNALPVDAILAEMRKRAISSLLFLDACRSSLGRGFEAIRPEGSSGGTGAQRQTSVAPRSNSGGGSAPALGGFYYVYAAAPNATAADGDGAHSPFTQAFLANVATPGRIVQELVIDVTRDVIKAARQVPYADGSLTEEVFLNGRLSDRAVADRSGKLASNAAIARERGDRAAALVDSLSGLSRSWPRGRGSSVFDDAKRSLLLSYEMNVVRFSGHTDEVHYVVPSPDGSLVLTSSSDGTLRGFDEETGALLYEVDLGMRQWPTRPDFSPDGAMFAHGQLNGVSIRSAETGQLIRKLGEDIRQVSRVRFSREGNKLAISGPFDGAKVLDVTTGRELVTASPSEILFAKALAFSPGDGRLAATYVESGKRALIQNAKTGETLTSIECDNACLREPVFFSGGDKVVVCCSNSLRAYSIPSGDVASEYRVPGDFRDSFNDVAVSADGRWVAAGDLHGRIHFWDAESARYEGIYEAHTGRITKVAFSSDGAKLYSSSADGLAQRITGGTYDRVTLVHDSQEVNAVVVSPDGARAVTAHLDGKPRIWEISGPRTGELLTVLPKHKSGLSDVAYSRDGRYFATISNDCVTRLWRAPGGAIVRDLPGAGNPDNTCRAVAFSPDSRRVAYVTDSDIRIWDISSSKMSTIVTGWQASMQDIAFSPDGNDIAASGDEGIGVWRISDGAQTFRAPAPLKFPRRIAFSPNGESIGVVYWNSGAQILSARDGSLLMSLDGHSGEVRDIDFSPNGERILTAGADRDLRFWDADTGAFLLQYSGHLNGIWSAEFSRDGSSIATAAYDGTAKIWDAGLYGPELLNAAYDLLTDDLRAEVERERIRYWEVDPQLLQ